jgi:hypothetical protein
MQSTIRLLPGNALDVEIRDVKWPQGQFSTHIATTAANGKVILYGMSWVGVN